MTKYEYLAREVKRLYQLRTEVKVTPVVVGALGTIPKKLELCGEGRNWGCCGCASEGSEILREGWQNTWESVWEDVGV